MLSRGVTGVYARSITLVGLLEVGEELGDSCGDSVREMM